MNKYEDGKKFATSHDTASRLADQQAKEQGRAEAFRFLVMGEQARAIRDAREALLAEALQGVEVTGDGGIRAVGYAQSRRPTYQEVLTVLRTLKADTGVVAGKEALDRAIRVFESMEAAR